MERETFKAGQIAPRSGTYEELDARGKIVKEARVSKGNHLPPTMDANHCYRLCEGGRSQGMRSAAHSANPRRSRTGESWEKNPRR